MESSHTFSGVTVFVTSRPQTSNWPRAKSWRAAGSSCEERVTAMNVLKHASRFKAVRLSPPSKNSEAASVVDGSSSVCVSHGGVNTCVRSFVVAQTGSPAAVVLQSTPDAMGAGFKAPPTHS